MAFLGLDHASLLVSNTGRSLKFYCEILDMEQLNRPNLGFPGAWLAAGQQSIHLLELPNPDQGLERPEHGGRDRHIALLTTDLNKTRSALDRAGWHYTLSRSDRAALFCRDPDGNALEIAEA
ncbi:MAG: VOC family protein [Gammaproteobacteria bacterium]|nr:MAG: VOC family protein [Gammaproteobacteria bacterium]